MSDHGDLRRQDREARLRARREFVRPLALEAGAGTGKTATLVQRIVAWCLGPGFERQRGAGGSIPERVLQRLVAITFTEAAAAEMSLRVSRAFAELGAGRGPVGLPADELARELGLSLEQLSERARAFAEAGQHLRLSTIHAFAAELLLEAPLEAGLHPRPTIDAEGEALRRAAREAVEAELAVALGPEPNPAWLHLAQQGFGPAEIEAELVRLLTLGVEPARQQTLGIEAEGLQSLGVEQLELPARALSLAGFERWRTAVLEALEPLHRELGAPGIKWSRSKRGPKIQGGLAFLRAQLAEPAVDEGQASERLERLRTEPRLSELEQPLRTAWAKGDFNGEERKQLSDLAGIEEAAGRLARELAALRGFDQATAAAALAVLAPLLAAARRRLKRRGVLGFDDLLRRASRLLAERPEVLRRQRERLDQLLVDEFQDTDQRQCDLVAALALEGPPASRPGLFVVGDPKQSIYAWRQADLAAYEDFLERLVDQGGERRHLSVNHRSSAEILAEVERVLEPAMVAKPGRQPPFVALVTPELGAKDETRPPAGRPAVSYWAPPENASQGRITNAQRVLAEAEAFAREARSLHDQAGVPYGQMALLLRATGDQERYLEALRRAGVPYLVARDKSYYRRREVIDAAAWVRLVLDPTDSLALVTWLRSPAVGVPDGALEPLWRSELLGRIQRLGAAPDREERQRIATLVDGIARGLPPLPGLERIAAWPASLCGALEALGELRGAYGQLSAERFVERMRRRSLQEFGESTRFLGHFARANLERFQRQLERRLLDGRGDIEALLGSLRDQVALAKEAEEARPRGQDQDALAVLTIHKAKGLDFQVVFIGQTYKDLSRGRRGAPSAEFERGATEPQWRLFGASSLGLLAALEKREQRERAEWVRLLYVAMTRAKARLVIGVGAAREATGTEAAPQPEAAPRPPGEPSEGKSFEAFLALAGLPPDSGAARSVEWERAPSLPAEGSDAAPPRPAAASFEPPPGLPAERDPAAALRRQERPLSAGAAGAAERSGRAGAQGEPDGGERGADEPTGGGPARPETDPEAALAVGARLHGLLEGHRPGDRRSGRFAARAKDLLGELARELPDAARKSALARAEELLSALERGPLLERLEGLEAAIVARELPLLAPPDAPDSGPIGPYTGTLDLLYREGERWVVADFKTDRTGAANPSAHGRYRAQLGRYRAALEQALDLPAGQVLLELWWLESGRIERLDDPPSAGPSP